MNHSVLYGQEVLILARESYSVWDIREVVDPTTCQQRPAKYIKAGQAELWCCVYPCRLSLEWLHKTQPPVTGAAPHT